MAGGATRAADATGTGEGRIRLGIVTPTYERPELLWRLHRSLAEGAGNDGGVDWLHCVVDDGSAADYADALARCNALTGRLRADRIPNAGALAARNRAIDLAMAAGCTHLAFMDDDDTVVPGGLARVAARIREHPDARWLLFPSVWPDGRTVPWPERPTTVSWFADVVLGRRFGSDNLIVVATGLVGATRFSRRGRNQREWQFLLRLSGKDDRVLVCPDPVQEKRYLPDGLSASAGQGASSPAQIANNVERAVRYWARRPLSPRLFAGACRQVAAAPLRLLGYVATSARRSR